MQPPQLGGIWACRPTAMVIENSRLVPIRLPRVPQDVVVGGSGCERFPLTVLSCPESREVLADQRA
jgi:hypothetical protein